MKPDISNIRVWGSIAYYKNKGTNIKKLEPRANKGYLIGYGQNQYRIWDITQNKPIWSRDVKILENQFKDSNTSTDNNNTTNVSNDEIEVSLSTNNKNQNITSNSTTSSNYDLDEIDLINTQSSNTTNTLINQSNSEILNDSFDELDELALVLFNTTNDEPKTYKQALESLDKLLNSGKDEVNKV